VGRSDLREGTFMTSPDLVVNGEDTGNWFKAIGGDESVPAWAQREVAELFVTQMAKDADRAEVEEVIQQPRSGDFGLMVPKTKIYFRLSGGHKDAAVFLAGLLATLLTHGAAATVLAPGIASLWTRVSKLSNDQRAMFAVMQQVAEQKSLSLYKDRIPQEDILAAWPSQMRQQGLRLLADLEEVGVVKRAGDEWKAVL
jgi:hypothetical protein